ncbi:MAG: L,D-transpeptidase family protein [Candidatus Omnitrophica bacterium]|nr:L,D-transpeptidase family protein [Candidatus Omnitrophota bacterium]
MPADPSVLDQVQEAVELTEQGKYLEAQGKYEGILCQSNLTEDEKVAIQKGYEELNMKLIFSRIETPNSFFHQVQPGESLYKIAKKYAVTIDLLRKSNSLTSDVIHPEMKLKVQKGVFSVQVDKSDNILILLLDEKPIKHYPVATGRDNRTPIGEFEIKNKLVNPTWFHAGTVVPPESPENILGTRWLGFDYQGYGIHGTTQPDSIGKQATSGCIRMHNHDVEEIYSILPRGTKVIIAD